MAPPLLLLGLVGVTAIDVARPAFAADVTTIAGNGGSGFSGDGGPATAAALNIPPGVAVAADGTVYIADSGNYRIRRISPGGVISTIAGNGTYGDGGDGNQATAAQLGGVEAIALSPADDILYISDNGMNRVRQVDLASGVITTFAGRGLDYIGHDGNGGPATAASIGIPEGITVDPAGNVYFTESAYCTVRKVAIATHVITRVAGSGLAGDCDSDGDGGNALAASLNSPNRVATDTAGNLFVVETGTHTVRRIDAVTHIITTIAGGGSTSPGFGDATTMDLGDVEGLAIDDADNLYVSTFNRVFKVDLDTGILSVFAGSGATGFSGDGGPALDATFSGIWGLDVRGDALFIADSNNNRIRAVVPPPLPDDLVINLATSQGFLNSLTTVAGSLLMVNVGGREYLVMPNATSVGLDVTVTGNHQLLVIDLNALQSAGGEITIAGNLSLQSVDLGSLTTVGGSLTVANNPSLNAILISGVTSIGGDLTIVGTATTVIDVSALTTVTGSLVISDNTSATTVDVSSVADVGGDVTITDNTAATTVDVSALAAAGGDIDLSGNTSLPVVDVSALATVTGSLIISDNTSATTVDVSSVADVGGDVTITGNTAATTVDVSALAAAGGDIDLSGNTSLPVVDVAGVATVGGDLIISGSTAATSIDVSGLESVGGDLTIVDNGSATVDVSADVDVGGDVTIETTGTGTISVDGEVTGDLTLDTTGYTVVTGTTPGGDIDLTSENLEATMRLQIQAASFTTPVGFSVSRVEPAALPPESGADAGGSPATVDPVAAYQFTFAVPAINRDATISFDIDLAQLDAATRSALLDALAAGTATMVTKGDAPGSAFQAFPLCAGGVEPTAGGCVRVETFDALGQPTGGIPARVRFSNVVGHFSTWAVAIVTRTTQANRTEICSTLGNRWPFDVQVFTFNSVKGENVTVTLAPNPARAFTPGRAALTLFGIVLFKGDASTLSNTITAKIPGTGAFYVTVSELLSRTGKFSGAYCVSLESSKDAWQTFRKR